MNILLVGSGGREHALAWKIVQSEHCDTLYCAPGNAGIAACATCVDIKDTDIDGLIAFAKDNAIDLVVVGPEAPLVAGLADALARENIRVFGPSQNAAQLEGSKAFMKDLCAKYAIPTAAYGTFSDADDAIAFIKKNGAPIVVKADGLAAGKGVIIAETEDDAIAAVNDMLSGNAFGESGHRVVIEEFMDGEELSFFALTDGKSILPLTSAQDHKRVFDGDKGPNTGGMGAYSPAHMMTPKLHDAIMETIIRPTVDGMKAEGCPFKGVLYAGIMLVGGTPKLLEYNIRFGDPECQPIMMRLESDLVDILTAVADETLENIIHQVRWSSQTALCVVMAAKGYPGSYPKNTPIGSLEQADAVDGTKTFHAGTAQDTDGQLVSVGGRVLGVTALGQTTEDAQAKAYTAVDTIDWPDGFCRRDIGWRAIKAQKAA